MKKIFLCLLLPTGVAFGQKSPLIPEFKPLNLPALGSDIPANALSRSRGSTVFLEDTGLNKLKAWTEGYKSSITGTLVLQGRFSHRTQNGSSVYIIQPDNMPCLVPVMTKIETMPSKRFRYRQPVEPMPNTGPRIEMGPGSKRNQP